MNHNHFITTHESNLPPFQIPGTVDADIGALEREIDEIAADVASMARLSAARDSESDRFGSAHSVTTRNSRSAPDGREKWGKFPLGARW